MVCMYNFLTLFREPWEHTENGVEIVLPKIKRENIKLSFSRNILNVNYIDKDNKTYTLRITCRYNVDIDNIIAKLKDDILYVTLPKKEKKKIQIQ